MWSRIYSVGGQVLFACPPSLGNLRQPLEKGVAGPKKNHNFDAAGGKQTAKRPLYSCDWEKGTLGRGIEKKEERRKKIHSVRKPSDRSSDEPSEGKINRRLYRS